MGKKKHQFPLRLSVGLYGECQALSFKHQVSLNLLFEEMIRFSLRSQTFAQFLMNSYPPKIEHGHFIYVRDKG